ncbi:MAG: thiamine phosphate synthase [Pseudomonadota bacterium]|nr:thiamine phosphate synthase [Pseudomonadota bacterium]
MSECQLYLITPEVFELEHFSEALTAALKPGNVACVQLRQKLLPKETIVRSIEVLKPLVHKKNIPFILNDDAQLAAETDCDGVHIGQEDISFENARKILGEKSIIGVTCLDSYHLAMEASEKGADYVAFGAFYPSATKKSKGQPTTEILQKWSSNTTIPCVAIGGITPLNCIPLVSAGADFLSVVSSIWEHPEGPEIAVTEFNNAITNVK